MPAATPSLEELAQALQTYAITTLWLTAGLFHLMVDAQLAALSAVAQVLAGGDVLSVGHVRRLLEQPGERVLINGYGPTESTTFACCHRMRSFKEMPGSVPIGRPIANTQVYILDGYQQPVPAGIAGELYVGGAGLALGYLNQEQLSAQQFISSPVVGARLYKTGDRVRYLGDGTIEFLGRWDAQVKIRGYRIEIGEVESVLHSHPQVREGVVLPAQDRLVAYVVGVGGRPVSEVELRTFLKEVLPEPMVPTIFVNVAALPLTANGKVDRKALPAPAPARETNSIAPRTALELQLVQLWEELLALHPIGVTENFFDLGGHSLLAVHLIAQIQKRLGQHLPLAALFKHGTIEGLAALLQTRDLAVSPLVALQPLGCKRPFFCVHPAGGGVMCLRDLVRHLGQDQPCYGLQARGIEDDQEPFTDVTAMAAYYLQALRALQPEGPYRLGGYSMGAIVAFEMAQQLQCAGQTVALLAVLDVGAPGCTHLQVRVEEAQILADLAANMNIPLTYEALMALPETERLSTWVEYGRIAYALPAAMDLQLAQRFLQVYQANLQAIASYNPVPYSGRVILFQAQDHGLDFAPDWEALTIGIDVYTVAGSHETLLTEPHVPALAALLRTHLDTVTNT